jgi:hypothetical protein
MKTALPGGRYSWAGICCSISFQALILRRRHTQHKGSSPALEVSAPHTEHGAAFLSSRSGETDRFACSNRSAGTTASGLICGLRFISMYSARFHYRRTASISQVAEGKFHTTRLRESAPPRQHPGKTRIAGISVRRQLGHIYPEDRSPPARYGYKWGSAPRLAGDFGYSAFAFSCLTFSDAVSEARVVPNS